MFSLGRILNISKSFSMYKETKKGKETFRDSENYCYCSELSSHGNHGNHHNKTLHLLTP